MAGVQEAYKLDNLKNVVSVFVPGSPVNRRLIGQTGPAYFERRWQSRSFIEELEADPVIVPYAHLKGRTPKGYTVMPVFGDHTGGLPDEESTSALAGGFISALGGQHRIFEL